MDIDLLSAADLQAIALEKMKEEGFPKEYRRAAKALVTDMVAIEEMAAEEDDLLFGEEDLDEDFDLEDFDDDFGLEDLDFATEGLTDWAVGKAKALRDHCIKAAKYVAMSPIHASKKIAGEFTQAAKDLGKHTIDDIVHGARRGLRAASQRQIEDIANAGFQKLIGYIKEEVPGLLGKLTNKAGTMFRRGKPLTRKERAMNFLREHKGKIGIGAGLAAVGAGGAYALTRRQRDNARDGI